jgi:hypothetical protein
MRGWRRTSTSKTTSGCKNTPPLRLEYLTLAKTHQAIILQLLINTLEDLLTGFSSDLDPRNFYAAFKMSRFGILNSRSMSRMTTETWTQVADSTEKLFNDYSDMLRPWLDGETPLVVSAVPLISSSKVGVRRQVELRIIAWEATLASLRDPFSKGCRLQHALDSVSYYEGDDKAFLVSQLTKCFTLLEQMRIRMREFDGKNFP